MQCDGWWWSEGTWCAPALTGSAGDARPDGVRRLSYRGRPPRRRAGARFGESLGADCACGCSAATALAAALTGNAIVGGSDPHALSKGGFVIEDTCIGPPDGFGINPASGQPTPDAKPAIADFVAGRCEITAIDGHTATGRIGFTATVYDARNGNARTVDHGAFILRDGTIYAQGDGDLAVEQS